MYWYKWKASATLALSCGLFFIAALSACKPDIKENGANLTYFDINGYFSKDSLRLSKQNPMIIKSVEHNGDIQTKKMHIANWGLELSLFKLSDINKPAWKDSYAIQSGGDITFYKAKDPELKTRSLIIKQVNGQVKWILIYNHTKNLLYETDEKLSYFPDSLYLIEKSQRVRFLGTNKYRIKGLF